MLRLCSIVPLLLVACSSGDDRPLDAGTTTTDAGAGDASSTDDAGSTTDAGSGGCDLVGLDPEVVHFDTDDGVTLEAAYFPTGEVGGPAAVLLHMVPPFNDRGNYPRRFIDRLVERGVTVLNVDRRGAGGSEGTAEEAYTGPNGKLDAKAAVEYLLADECAVDPDRIAIVGASNGTTTALDYTVFAADDGSVPAPTALVFLTGGEYTEAQNAVDDNRGVLDPLPILFVFSTDERAWSVQFEPGAPDTWQLLEYDPGAHGTGMFDTAPESMDDVADFLEARI